MHAPPHIIVCIHLEHTNTEFHTEIQDNTSASKVATITQNRYPGLEVLQVVIVS